MAATPNPEVFLDSAYVIALAHPTDAHHAQAMAVSRQLIESRTRIVTTRAVLLEIGNALSKLKVREAAFRVISHLQNSPLVEIVPVTEELAGTGWNLFCRRPDKDWSWTDCISFVVMGERGLKQALTSDAHFEQAGFVALLRE
jgi:predicted nucleic acid-binding protein